MARHQSYSGGAWPIWGIQGFGEDWGDIRPLGLEANRVGPLGSALHMSRLSSAWGEADWWVHDGQIVVKSMISAHFESNLNGIFNAMFKSYIKVQ